ncbi:hypothetical protein [Salinicoccus roseus]|nr:hypothetical protein [Salinicoccus roseus]
MINWDDEIYPTAVVPIFFRTRRECAGAAESTDKERMTKWKLQ